MSDLQIHSIDDDLIEAISTFRRKLPGWWFSLGDCSVSRDASCGPDRNGPDAHLLEDREFDDGFHADLDEAGSTMAEALRDVMRQGLEAKVRKA